MALARCPASCGEIIQGWILGSEKLVSCPVDWYSEVEISTGSPLPTERTRMRAMVNLVLRHWQLPSSLSREIRIECRSTIPVAKGMASSTADIAATAVATSRHYGYSLDEPTLARLCVMLEPTDSTVFRHLTLFDHNSASMHIACHGLPAMDILLLESPLILRTEDYHRLPREPVLKTHAAELDSAWQQVQQACAHRSPALLAEAATRSAIASQRLLPKPAFRELMSLVEKCDLYGLNVAHSGSVVGLFCDRKKQDVEKVCWHLKKTQLSAHWPEQHLLRLVEGGVKER
ncbi:L-threonine kinase [Yokenella regensburgei]|uniref:L-threonine kinase n=1 Tax=Yokenella regensburgei TaxID=158877 RepID=UPI003F18BB5F